MTVNQPKLKKLNRFTTLPFLIDYLERKKMVLLNPESWEDKNDSLILREYCVRAGVDKLFALCFTDKSETIHHWKTFSHGSSGCCIEFDAQSLIKIFQSTSGLRYGLVEYRRINDDTLNAIDVEKIPFTKRWPYQFEREYRIIATGSSNESVYELTVPISTINRITFAQQIPPSVFDTVKQFLIKSYPELLATEIVRSTIYENKSWIKKFRSSEPE